MSTTLAEHVAAFLSDMARVARLRPHTLRAYHYELTAAAAALTAPLDQLTFTALEQWVSRDAVSAATVARRTATPKALRMLRAHLKTLRGQPPHAPLFRSPRGTRVSYDALHYQWARSVRQRVSWMPRANRAIPSINSATRGAANSSSTATAW